MNNVALSRHALITCVAAAVLAGCSGSQPPIGTSASPQLLGDAAPTPLPSGAVSHRASGLVPRYPQSSQPLLYIGSDNPSAIDIFPLTGPNQQQIGTISNGVGAPWGLSIDANDSLYVANAGNGTVTVYPYGSTIPSMETKFAFCCGGRPPNATAICTG